MRKLNKTQCARKATLAAELSSRHDALEQATQNYNDAIRECTEFRDEVVGEMEEYAGERSEKWAETESGQQYEEWKSSWENEDFEEVELPDMPNFEELPEEPGYC